MTTGHATASSSIVVSILFRVPIVRAGVAATLSAAPGLLVRIAASGSEEASAADLLQAIAGVDVLVADYDNALAAAGLLKRNAGLRFAQATKILLVSHRDGEADVRRALESGIQGYLPLDCRPDEMAGGVLSLHRGLRCLGRSAAERVAESFGYEALTDRETEVLRCVVAGDANKLVAKRLNIALGTVKVHVRSIMSKLNARTRTEAAAVAQRRGLCRDDAYNRDSSPRLLQRNGSVLGYADPRIAVGNPGVVQ